MNVMHLIHSGGFYGAEAVVLNLCLGSMKRNHHPILCCFVDKGTEKPEVGVRAERAGIQVQYVYLRGGMELHLLRELRGIVAEHHVDILHSHGYKPSFYCFLLKLLFSIRFVVTCHLWTNDTLFLRIYGMVEHVAMYAAERVFAVSQPIADDICRWPFFRGNTRVIHNGIDPFLYHHQDDLQGEALRNHLGLRGSSKVIGTLGRLSPQKAQHVLIEAAKLLKTRRDDFEILIAGSGDRKPLLEDLIRTYGLEDTVHLIGFREDVISTLQLLEVFVLCSDDEGLPIIMLEAMALGIPVVCTAVGDIPAVIEDGANGYLLQKGDAKALASKLEFLLENPEQRQRITTNATNTINTRYSIDTMVDSYLHEYEQIDKRHRK